MDKEHKKVQLVVTAKQQSGPVMVLLLQTNQSRGSFWQNITGSVEKNESYLDAAQRELSEETGIQSSKSSLKELNITHQFTDQFQRKVREKCYWLHLERVPEAIKIDPNEHRGHRWLAVHEFDQNSVKYASNFECLEKVRALLQEGQK